MYKYAYKIIWNYSRFSNELLLSKSDRDLRYLGPAASPTGSTEVANAAILINPLFASDCASWWGKLTKKVAKSNGIIILTWLPSQDWEDEDVQGEA